MLSACDRTPQAQKNPRRRTPPATQVATTPPPEPTSRPASAPAANEALASYLYFQYPTDANGASVDPVSGASVDLGSNPWGVVRQFPPARLRLNVKGDDGASAMLFSDDPKEAISKNWAGDRYYFQMDLPYVQGLQQLDGARFGYQMSPNEQEESPNGVFLKGDRYHLEPANAVIRFDGAPPHVTVQVWGQFLQYDSTDPKSPPVVVTVQGVLMPKVEAKD
jgi:hypothetical protein